MFRNGQNEPKSAKCVLSMVLLYVTMATLLGLPKYLFWILKEETCGCFKEYFSHLNTKLFFHQNMRPKKALNSLRLSRNKLRYQINHNLKIVCRLHILEGNIGNRCKYSLKAQNNPFF